MSDEQAELEFDDTLSTNRGNIPSVGLHQDVDFPAYQSWRAINSGVCKWMGVSMLHGNQALNGLIASDDTTSRKFGRATHKRVLEPAEYAAELLVSDVCAAITGKGMRCVNQGKYYLSGQWYCGTKSHKPSGAAEPLDYVNPDEVDRIEQIAERLHSHFAMDLLKAKGFSEVSLAWEYLGLLLKGRIDRLECHNEFAIDLKKVQVGKGSKTDCREAIKKWSYHKQAAMYVNGVEAITGKRPNFYWVFVEENRPFDLNILQASEEDLEIGWAEITKVLRGYANCVKAGRFPGYIASVESMMDPVTGNMGGLPPWYVKLYRDGKL